jgi:glycosyltransferase involved in cell wall biosynthesis
MRFVFVAYTFQPDYTSPQAWISLIHPLHAVMRALSANHEVFYTGEIGFEGQYTVEGVHYHFIHCKKSRSRFPFRLNKMVAGLRPDLVIVLGLKSPVQQLLLRNKLANSTLVFARHHADRPSKGFRKMLLRWNAKKADAFLFTSKGNAMDWIDAGIIPEHKIIELMAGSTTFKKKDKNTCRTSTGVEGSPAFIWVGRLNKNKDPMTVVHAFQKYVRLQPAARLFMIYQDGELEVTIREVINADPFISGKIFLLGPKKNSLLEDYFNAADYYISASHREGGSFALTEAMACGCIPVVTKIPAALKVISDEKYGYSFLAGDEHALLELFKKLPISNLETFSKNVQEHFINNYSPKAIADKIAAAALQMKK